MGASFLYFSRSGRRARAHRALLHAHEALLHVRDQVRGKVTPVWPWYLPPRSL